MPARAYASANLGRQIAALLDPETPVADVTAGKARPEFKLLGVAAKVGGGQLAGDDFAVTARWGIAGKGGITMPGAGDAGGREFSAPESAALGDAQALLGADMLDVHLNAAAYWRNVPREVWEYTLGGYQVLKKWLSYREQALLDRPLSVDEVAYFSHTVRRIAALLLLGPQLDLNYAQIKAETYPWPSAQLP